MSNKRQRTARSGIGFQDDSRDSNDYHSMDYVAEDEESSNALLGLQKAQAQMYADIKRQFLDDEEKRFHKSWTAKKKDEMRYEISQEMKERHRKELKAERVEVARVNKELARERERCEWLRKKLRDLREEFGIAKEDEKGEDEQDGQDQADEVEEADGVDRGRED